MGHGRGFRLTGLRAARRSALFSQSDLSHAARVTRETVANLERGKHGAHPGTLRRLAAALGVPPERLLGAPEPGTAD